MFYYILALVCLASLVGFVVILFRQVKINRQNNLDYHRLDNFESTSLALDFLAFKIVHWCRLLASRVYAFSLHFIRNSISLFRYLLVKVERRFNHWVAGLPEANTVHKSDKMSFFLKEIKDHKETVMAEIKNDVAKDEFEK